MSSSHALRHAAFAVAVTALLAVSGCVYAPPGATVAYAYGGYPYAYPYAYGSWWGGWGWPYYAGGWWGGCCYGGYGYHGYYGGYGGYGGGYHGGGGGGWHR